MTDNEGFSFEAKPRAIKTNRTKYRRQVGQNDSLNRPDS